MEHKAFKVVMERVNKTKIQAMRTVLIAGGSGLVGSRLQHMLAEKGYTVRLLSRRPAGPGQFRWDPAAGVADEAALDGVDAVINLAGEGIADGRWTAARRQRIHDSRVQAAQVLRAAFQQTKRFPAVYLSASAIGYYGNSGERRMTETDAPVESGFMPDVCIAWEQGAEAIAALGIRTGIFRIGIVLSTRGGALYEIIKPLRFGLGAYFGDGRAWYSWIHIDDLCRMLIWAMENGQVEGIYNAVSPEPARNIDLVRAAIRARRRPALLLPAPAFALRLLLGKMAAVVLNSNLVSADNVIQAGFTFKYPNLPGALESLFAEKK